MMQRWWSTWCEPGIDISMTSSSAAAAAAAHRRLCGTLAHIAPHPCRPSLRSSPRCPAAAPSVAQSSLVRRSTAAAAEHGCAPAASFSSSSAPPLSTAYSSRFKPIIAPPAADDAERLCVVLDMDECILHSYFEPTLPAALSSSAVPGDISAGCPAPPPSASTPPFLHPRLRRHYHVTFTLRDGADCERVYTSFRPHLQPFLSTVSARYELILFTSALPVYAAPVLSYLSQQYGARFRHQLYRDATVGMAAFDYVKDARRLGRDMRRLVIIDNNPYAMIACPDNALLVSDWTGGDRGHEQQQQQQQDDTLQQMLPLLERLDAASRRKDGELGDVRPVLRSIFGFRQRLERVVKFEPIDDSVY